MLATDDLLLIANVRAAISKGKTGEIRRRAGLTQDEVASVVGVTASCVSHWEAGRRLPRGKVARRYGRLLAALEEGIPEKREAGQPASEPLADERDGAESTAA
jgi:DNA-binding XRE family transcriptional regulator